MYIEDYVLGDIIIISLSTLYVHCGGYIDDYELGVQDILGDYVLVV